MMPLCGRRNKKERDEKNPTEHKIQIQNQSGELHFVRAEFITTLSSFLSSNLPVVVRAESVT
jgi:hypothetical protein